jgi:hypothetical protein
MPLYSLMSRRMRHSVACLWRKDRCLSTRSPHVMIVILPLCPHHYRFEPSQSFPHRPLGKIKQLSRRMKGSESMSVVVEDQLV